MNRDELEMRLATTLAPMLFTVASLSVGAMALVTEPNKTYVDEFLLALAAFSVISVSFLLDGAMDKLALSFSERVQFLGHGYLCFSIVIGGLTIIIPIVYQLRSSSTIGATFSLYIGAGVCMFGKMMTQGGNNIWLAGLVILYAISAYVLLK